VLLYPTSSWIMTTSGCTPIVGIIVTDKIIMKIKTIKRINGVVKSRRTRRVDLKSNLISFFAIIHALLLIIYLFTSSISPFHPIILTTASSKSPFSVECLLMILEGVSSATNTPLLRMPTRSHNRSALIIS